MKILDKEYFLNKKVISIALFVIIAILALIMYKVKTVKEVDLSEYSVDFENEDLVIYEKKLNMNDLGDGENVSVTRSGINKYYSKIEGCSWKITSEYPKGEKGPFEKTCKLSTSKHSYRVVNKGYRDYEIFMDDKLFLKKEIGICFDTNVNFVGIIDDKFIFSFENCKDDKLENREETILIDDVDALNNLEYKSAFYPFELNKKLFYFLSKKDELAFNYGNEIIKTSYKGVFRGCCMAARLNPHTNGEVVDFFGLKDDGWYHVQIRSKK